MPLVKVKDLLKHATENKYGVAAFNTLNFETVKWAVRAAEQERVPVIVQLYPGFERYIPMNYISNMAMDLAGKSDVPIAVHLDHSATADIAIAGIRDGFPSVMVDGSAQPFEDNVAMTKEVVKVARVFGVDVEAELGHVGSGAKLEDYTREDLFTDPDQAAEFVERTGCDTLAIAVGNAHGAYKQEPDLDFNRIKAIRSKLTIPLVMHGGSGIPDEQMKQAVNLGMSKFNIATEYFAAFAQELANGLQDEKMKGSAVGLFFGIEQAVIDFARSKIRMLNPNNYSVK